MKVGYVRVSSSEQNTARQDVLMAELGVERVFTDKASGKSKDERAELMAMLEFVRSGDTVIVESISRFARNTRDLLSIVDLLKCKGVSFISKKEAIDTNTPAGEFMLTVFGALAQLEREFMLDRQREGIAEAKKAGKYKGRIPVAVDERKFADVYRLWRDGELTAVRAMEIVALKRSTFYRRVKEYEEAQRVSV